MKAHVIHTVQKQKIVRIIVLVVTIDVMNVKPVPKTVLKPLRRPMRISLKPRFMVRFIYQNSGSRVSSADFGTLSLRFAELWTHRKLIRG